MFVSPEATILTGTSSGVSTRRVPSFVLINTTLFIPPPETIVSPFTVTFSRFTLPVPTASEIYKSPSTIAFFMIIPGATTERLLFIVLFFKSYMPSSE